MTSLCFDIRTKKCPYIKSVWISSVQILNHDFTMLWYPDKKMSGFQTVWISSVRILNHDFTMLWYPGVKLSVYQSTLDIECPDIESCLHYALITGRKIVRTSKQSGYRVSIYWIMPSLCFDIRTKKCLDFKQSGYRVSGYWIMLCDASISGNRKPGYHCISTVFFSKKDLMLLSATFNRSARV